ncbi:MAG: hypothetical protein ACYTBJ_22160 [Planctomycetota bacterium]|jgi:hypothetical protein
MDIKIYTLKYKWQKYIPNWILNIFIKPKILKNAQLEECDLITNDNSINKRQVTFELGVHDYE